MRSTQTRAFPLFERPPFGCPFGGWLAGGPTSAGSGSIKGWCDDMRRPLSAQIPFAPAGERHEDQVRAQWFPQCCNGARPSLVRLGTAGSTTPATARAGTPATSAASARWPDTGARARSCVPTRSSGFFLFSFFSVLKVSFSIFPRLRAQACASTAVPLHAIGIAMHSVQLRSKCSRTQGQQPPAHSGTCVSYASLSVSLPCTCTPSFNDHMVAQPGPHRIPKSTPKSAKTIALQAPKPSL